MWNRARDFAIEAAAFAGSLLASIACAGVVLLIIAGIAHVANGPYPVMTVADCSAKGVAVLDRYGDLRECHVGGSK